MDYYKFVTDPLFFSFLREIDRSIADEAHEKPCDECAGKLDRGNFPRAGYGMPNVHEDDRLRFSFCCRNCRGRVTPASLRFLRGKAYVTIVIVLLSAIQHGLSPDRVAAHTLGRLKEELSRFHLVEMKIGSSTHKTLQKIPIELAACLKKIGLQKALTLPN